MDIKNIFGKINQNGFVIKVKNMSKDQCDKIVTWIREDVRKVRYEKMMKKLKK